MMTFVVKTLRAFSLLSLILISACKSDEEKFWESVQINENNNSFAFVFTSTNIPFAGEYYSSIINRVESNKVPNVNADRVVFLSMFPSELDPLWNPIAENLKFEYDENGNNTFSNYPAFVNNTVMYNFDTTSFYKSIQDKALVSAPLQVGTLIKADQGVLTFYVKIKYNVSFSKNHSIAIYLYEKEKVDVQETNSGTNVSFKHKNVYLTSIDNLFFGKKITGTFSIDTEKQYEFSHNIGTYNLNNLGIATVVYELDNNDKAISVLNSTSN